MQVGLSNYQVGNSSVVERVDNKKTEKKTEDKYASVSAYQAYLKDKYPCLTASDYKVTISPAYLEKCIKNPKEAEGLEKSLEHLPISHQNMTASWKALGARVVNEQWIFDENGNCGGSPSMYVTNSNSLSGSSIQDKISEKKDQRKMPSPQEHYEKRKLLREQFEERLAEKEYLKDQMEEEEIKEKMLKKSVLSKEQNAGRFIERYETNILKS
ncbi:MAG: hypothetical protein NC302_11270 [Bacteroidales bacterium]|nr:hypothetical protein [Bacteroidales bacterium]MCM1416931.1 hypothetical protein [bacterium]MCM1424624.1 hypothetical protein [bacterium]